MEPKEKMAKQPFTVLRNPAKVVEMPKEEAEQLTIPIQKEVFAPPLTNEGPQEQEFGFPGGQK